MSKNTEDKIVLSLDASTKSTGWAIFKNEKMIAYGIIVAGDPNVHIRIDHIAKEIKKIIIEYQPDEVILEDVILSDVKNNNNVFKALMYLQGFIVHVLEFYGVKYSFFVASHWRKICGIRTGAQVKRTELKNKSIAFVKKHYNIDVNDDIADAICIGYAKINEDKEDIEEKEITNVDGFEFG